MLANMSHASYESTTSRVLGIPEILEIIFSFMDEEDNKRNACVCKRWSDIALNHLWKEMYGLGQLFRLLGPLRLREDTDGPIVEVSHWCSQSFQCLRSFRDSRRQLTQMIGNG